jgi:hypothetical protein
MAKKNVADVPAPKMKIVVSEPGMFMETLRKHADSAVAVLPHGVDWTPVVESDNPLEAIIRLPLCREVSHG